MTFGIIDGKDNSNLALYFSDVGKLFWVYRLWYYTHNSVGLGRTTIKKQTICSIQYYKKITETT